MTHEPPTTPDTNPQRIPIAPAFPGETASKIPRTTSSIRLAAIMALVAAGVQLLYLADSLDDPAFLIPVVDAGDYHRAAVRFASGGSLYDGPFWQPPMFPLALGLLYRVIGENILIARLLLALLATLSSVLVWWIGRAAFNARVGMLAAVLLALNGPYLFYANQLMPVGLAVFLILLALAAWMRCLRQPTTDRCVLFGLLVGAATITIPNCIVLTLLPATHLFGWARRSRQWHPPIRAMTAVLLGVAVPVFAVSVRNYQASGDWVLISTNGGINLHLGNNPDTQRTLSIRPGEAWASLVRESCADHPRTPAEQHRYFSRKVWEFVATQPLAFAKGLAEKLVQLLNSREIPRNEDIYSFRDRSWTLTVLAWRVAGFAFPWGLLCPLALYSIFHARRREFSADRRALQHALLLFTLGYAATIIAFFVSSRYRVPIVPIICLFAADGLLALLSDLRGNSESAGRHRFGPMTVALLAGLVICNWPIRVATVGVNFRAEIQYFLGHAFNDRQAYPEAESHFRNAISLDPDYVAAYSALAHFLATTGRFDEAVQVAKTATRLDPNSAQSRWIFADIFHRMNRLDDAERTYREALQIDPLSPDAHSGLAEVVLQAGRNDEAIGHYRLAVALSPEPGVWLVRLADLLAERGEFEDAIPLYERVIRSAEDPRVLNTLAWLLATCPRTELRDCERATRLAERLCRQTDYQNAVALDTLAAAHAECGRLDLALLHIRRAIDLATQTGDAVAAADFRTRLQLYESVLARRSQAP